MSTERNAIDIDLQEEADQAAVLRHAFQGEPLDPEVRRRVHERAARITEEIYRVHGLIDDETFQELLRDDDELWPTSSMCPSRCAGSFIVR